MRTREKILVVIFTVAAILLWAGITLHASDYDGSRRPLESMAVNNLTLGVSDSLTVVINRLRGSLDAGSLWWAGISLLALMMVALVLKFGRDAEIKSLRSRANTLEERLSEAVSRREHAEKSLQSERNKKDNLAREKDSAVREVEETLNKLHRAATDLREKQNVLKARDGEVRTLRSEVSNLTAQLEDMTAERERTEKRLREEVSKRMEPLSSDNRAGETEPNINGTVQRLKTRLIESQEMLKIREAELETLRAQTNMLTGQLAAISTAKERAENLFQEELGRKTELLAEKDEVIKGLEESLNGQLKTLETALGEKQKLLDASGRELESLRFEAGVHTGRLEELAAAKSEAESLHQREVAKNGELIREKERSLERLEKDFSQRVLDLERQLRQKQQLIDGRDAELESARAEANDLNNRLSETSFAKGKAESALQEALRAQARIAERLTAAREQAESLLQDEIKHSNSLLQEKESALRDLEQNLGGQLRAFESRFSEKEEELKLREHEIQTLKAELGSLSERLGETAFAKERAEKFLQAELRKNQNLAHEKQSVIEEIEASFGTRLRALQEDLAETQQLLNSRDEQLEALRSEVDSLTEQLGETVSANDQADTMLQEDLRRSIQENEFLTREHGLALRAIQSLETELNENMKLLESRDGDLATLRSDLNGYVARLEQMEFDKIRAEQLLEEERGRREELLSNGAAVRDLEQNLTGRMHILEKELQQSQTLLKNRDNELATISSELNALKSQLVEMTTDREALEVQLGEERKKHNRLVEEARSTRKELEEALSGKISAMAIDVIEKNALLENRQQELEMLRSEITALNQQLSASQSAREQAERWLQQELKSRTELVPLNDSVFTHRKDSLSAKIETLENQLSEKQEALHKRDSQIESLVSELKEKKILLAREEIADLRSVRRRNTWKRRLAKLGIPTKQD